MSNESHPSPTGSSSSSLFGGGGGGASSNTAGVSGPSPYPSPSKPTWAQILNSHPNTPSNASASSTTTSATNAAHTGVPVSSSGSNGSSGGNVRGISPSSSSPSSQHSITATSTGGGGAAAAQTSGTTATTRSISPSQVTPSGGAFNFPGSRTGFMPNFYDQQQQQSQMNWPSNFNQSSSSSSWMVDDETQRHSNLAGSSSQQSLDSNHNTAGDGDGFDRLESSSPTSDWGKPVTTNNSTANGWSNFQQQQQTHNNPSRSNAVGNNNTTSNQWPEINNFYGTNSSTGVPFNLPQNNNDNNSASSTWQDASSGNTSDTLALATGSSNSSVINKHKSSSSAAMAASLTGALKSAIALGGANVDPASGNSDVVVVYVPQPKLVEQLGWDEPEIKVAKRANFDDGTSIWGDPMESMSVQVKKWTNGPKAALTNSTNTISQQQQQQQQQSSIVQKPVAANVQASNSATSTSQMTLNDENWPKQQSPTLPQQPSSSSSPWNDTAALPERGTPPPTSQQQANYRPQQSAPANWNSQSQQSGHHDEWLRDGMVDVSGWGLQGSQNKVPFDPYEGRIDASSWGVQGGADSGMGGPLPMNRNRFMNDYDLSEGTHDRHSMHGMSSYENQSMTDPYRQGSDLKSPIIGLGGLLPATGNPPQPHHMLPPSQLSFAPRPGPHYQPGNNLRPMNPNGISAPSGAIMGTGGLISPKLSTTSPVPNQAPYVPLAAKQGNIPSQSSQTPTPQQQGGGNTNNGAVHAQIMQQFRLAVQAGLISQDLLNTKLPPFMLQLLQKLFELQQKYQSLTIQLTDFSKHKQRFPITFFQTEYERLSKLITQKRQEMLVVQKQIHDAHAKLVQQQQQSGTSNSSSSLSQMMSNGPAGQNQPSSGGSSQSQDQLVERMQQSLNVDQSRLHQWTKQQTSARGAQSSSSMFAPPGLSQKDWQTGGNHPNENWENSQTNESNNNNQLGNMDTHNNQGGFGDPLSEFVDDADGPPPFVPGQLWNWKSALPSAEDNPHVTPSSFTIGPKGPSSSMDNLNVGGVDSAFSNPQLHHHMQRRSQSQWQHEQQGFQPSMNDWGKPQQYRGTSKPPQSLNHPPPSHSSFGGYRPYM